MSGTGSSQADNLHLQLGELVEAGDVHALAEAAASLHASDVADLLASIQDEALRVALLGALPSELGSEALSEMEEAERPGELLAALEPTKGAELVHELADDDAVDLISELDPHEARAILDALPPGEAHEIEGLLAYDEESAGGLMTTELVAVHASASAQQALEAIRRRGREVEDFYTVFVVDRLGKLEGAVPLAELILADPDQRVSELTEAYPVTVGPETDQEEVGHVLARYNLVSVPVCDDRGRLLGRITFDDVIDVIEAEQTEDILRMAGVSEEEEVRGEWKDAVRGRLPWLALNLFTLSVAASVVFAFGDTIERMWYLAAIMPIVAGLGGNSATQALAVTVRRIAVTSGPLEPRSDAVTKEFLVGLVNGMVVGLLAALLAWVAVQVDPEIHARLPMVVLASMWLNILVAGFAGAFIPTLLHRMGADPAVASSVFVTTLTDLVGFFLLLGLASWVLL